MKRIFLLQVILMVASFAMAQRTMLVEKIGTGRKYYYQVGDQLKLRVSASDTMLSGTLWAIGDSVISVAELRPFPVTISEINSVYKRFYFPKKFGKYMCIGSAAIFSIIGFNHLINNEQVFTPDMFYISGAMLGAGLISLSLSEKRCRIGTRWKVKILDFNLN